MEFIQTFALLGMVLLSFGVMFRVVRLRAVFYFLLFLLVSPALLSMIKSTGSGLRDSNLSWQVWMIMIFAVLIGLRVLIDRTFRRR